MCHRFRGSDTIVLKPRAQSVFVVKIWSQARCAVKLITGIVYHLLRH